MADITQTKGEKPEPQQDINEYPECVYGIYSEEPDPFIDVKYEHCNKEGRKHIDDFDNVQGDIIVMNDMGRTKPITHGRKYLAVDHVTLKLTDDYEVYEAGKAEISVVGRLKRSLEFLIQNNASKVIIEILKHGYIIPLLKYPAPAMFRNNASARNFIEFVRLEVSKLLDTGAVSETAVIPYIVNPLTVAVRDDKKRLVLDCRYLNKFILKLSVKFEGADVLLQFIKKGYFMISLDLKSGYHHIEINKFCKKLLGFSVVDEWGNLRYFYFNVLPFGLTSAGYVFTKVLRVWIKIWRDQAIRAVFFLDDFSIVASSLWKTYKHGQIVKRDLVNAGWVPNKDKSQWYPAQIVQWLGFIYNLIRGMIFVSKEKLFKLRCLLEICIHYDEVSVKFLAAIAGKIQSMQLGFGDIVFLKTRSMQMQIASAETWYESVVLSELTKLELEFWLHNVEEFNGIGFVDLIRLIS